MDLYLSGSSSYFFNCILAPEMDNVERGGTLKRKIAVSPMDLKTNEIEDDQRSLSSLSNKSDLDIFSPTDDIILPDDVDTLEELENSDCKYYLFEEVKNFEVF